MAHQAYNFSPLTPIKNKYIEVQNATSPLPCSRCVHVSYSGENRSKLLKLVTVFGKKPLEVKAEIFCAINIFRCWVIYGPLAQGE